jgi:hypothetical protein
MNHIAQEDFEGRVPADQQEFDSTVRPICAAQVQFSHRDDLHHPDDRLGNTREAERAVCILVVVLTVVTVTAFYLLWLKAGGTEEHVRVRPPNPVECAAARQLTHSSHLSPLLRRLS